MNNEKLVFLIYNIIFEDNFHNIKSCLLLDAEDIIKDLNEDYIKEERRQDYVEFKISEQIGYFYENFSCLQDFKYSLYRYNIDLKEFKCCLQEEWYGHLKYYAV